MTTAIVVAGGYSTRFGEADKAVAPLAGTPMIRRVADRIVDVVDRVVVNCRADQVDAIEAALSGYPRPVAFAVDETPGRGPVAGIGDGLRAVGEPTAFVVACDMPFVEPGVVEYLFERLDDHDAAVPRLDDGHLQPLQAVYRVDPAVAACERLLADGGAAATDVVAELDHVVVEERAIRERGTVRSFENVNDRAAFEAAERRLE